MSEYKKKNRDRSPWKKILYGNRDYPDNYTHESFLDEMKKNLFIREVSFREACYGASLVTRQISIVVIFICAFVYLYNEWIDPVRLIVYSGGATCLTYSVLFYGSYDFIRTSRNTLLYYFASIYLLSPVLKTLTESISTDTIYSTTVCMMLVHLIFFDYGVPALIVSSSLSLNAAVFGAVCLTSRLPDNASVTALIHATVQCFALAQLFLTKISPSFVTLSLLVIVTVTIRLLYSISAVMTFFYLSTIGFINVLCPYLFIKWYSYKDNIYGPWDEAEINVSPNVSE